MLKPKVDTKWHLHWHFDYPNAGVFTKQALWTATRGNLRRRHRTWWWGCHDATLSFTPWQPGVETLPGNDVMFVIFVIIIIIYFTTTFIAKENLERDCGKRL